MAAASGLRPVTVGVQTNVQAEEIPVDNVVMNFTSDMEVLVGLEEIMGTANCGSCQPVTQQQWFRGEQRCQNTSVCWPCSALSNVVAQSGYMTHEVAAGAMGLDTAVVAAKAGGDLNFVRAMNVMYDYLVQNKGQRKALSHYGAVRRTKQRAKQDIVRKVNPNDRWTMMMQGEGRCGILVYKDEGNVVYKCVLDILVPGNLLNKEKSGDVLEAIMGMLYLHSFEPDSVGKYGWAAQYVPELEQMITDYIEDRGQLALMLDTDAVRNAEVVNENHLVRRLSVMVQPMVEQVREMGNVVDTQRIAMETMVDRFNAVNERSAVARELISNLGNQVGGSAAVLLELRAMVNALATRVERIETQNDAIVARVDNPGVQAAGAQVQEPPNIAYQVVMQDGAEKVALEAAVEAYRERWAEWLNAQVKSRAEFDALMATQAREMSEGMRICRRGSTRPSRTGTSTTVVTARILGSGWGTSGGWVCGSWRPGARR